MAASLRGRDGTAGFCLGLHQAAIPAPSLTFVKPGLPQTFWQALEELGLEFEFRHLGNDVFN